MKVQLKVKHLVACFSGVIVLLLLFILFFQPKLESWSINRQIANGNIDGAKEQIVASIEDNSRNRTNLIIDYMIEPVHTDGYDVFIGPGGSSHSLDVNTNRIFNIEETVPYIEEYLEEAPANDYTLRAVEIVTLFYKENGEYEKVSSVIEEVVSQFSDDDYIYHHLNILAIEEALDVKELIIAQEKIDEYEHEVTDHFQDQKMQLAYLQAKLYVNQGQKEKAVLHLEDAIDQFSDWHDSLLDEFNDDEGYTNRWLGSPYYNNLIDLQEELLNVNGDGDFHNLEGKVMKSNGEPLSNVVVVLRDAADDFYSSSLENERHYTVTNADGSFQFNHVAPGSYQAYIGLSFEQVDGWVWPVDMYETIEVGGIGAEPYNIVLTPLIDTHTPTKYEVIEENEITFSWENYDGAHSYSLFVGIQVDGSALSSPFKESIKESSITVSVDDLYNQRVGVMFGEGEWDNVQGESLLAFTNTEGTFFWSVSAFNEAGELIGQSNGYRLQEETMGDIPFFHLNERKMTEADNLLLEGKIEKAYATYKKDVKNNSDDVHSLRMLNRIKAVSDEEHEEALAYLLALGNVNPIPDIVVDIMQHYSNKGSWVEVRKWYEKMVGDESNRSISADAMYGKALIMDEEYEEARQLFRDTVEKDTLNSYVGYLIALELYHDNSFENVVRIADSNPQRGHEAPEWANILKEMKEDGINNEQLKEAIYLFFTNDKDRLHKLIDEKESLKPFIDSLKSF
ncbi:carboxypeptidase regulatory-like domain-containing protein [Evansella cellulosilytica]|uniref:Carboxypeptidase regulatory-like domain-containing protein n=1 Tax=Evansella cellulosilytica (strain ATCC 21833 / DSM 2522 / FERM P-1141 / JCM 9156 / N-4) TaxID=649639 RepID=E6TWA3_EVAC2|nr:carboxypeptidase regulatory-like domain-containing protein [Evansella cellulosilytica]ADU31059.1 hypothetical protein Bcell_2806 [Evansella cellulosilytica DSM 2522]